MALAVISVATTHSADRKPRLVVLIERRAWLCWVAAFGSMTVGATYWEVTHRYDAYTAGPLHLIWASIAFFLLLPAVFSSNATSIPRRVLSTRVLAWLGIISYGIYLWHFPLMAKLAVALGRTGLRTNGLAFTALLCVVVTGVAVACAATSYYLVERPFLRLKPGRRHQLSSPTIVATISEPVDHGAARQ